MSEPELDIGWRPLGIARFASELPGIASALRGVLLRSIRRQMVEPRKRFFDAQRMYTNMHARRVRRLSGATARALHCHG